LNCSSCHMINGIGGTTAPDLSYVGAKRDRTWFIGHFKDPKAFVPGSVMPAYGNLNEKELNDLTHYMLTLKQEVTK
ncbi:MAG: cbb3-type cytochrome c oxidase subunit II, partial [Thermodesulfovibrionales bacterium]|nr:cbb3-type cytochrome c oxidase subunit II [Thermodesulfovibrionales bacterium]